MAAGIHVLKTVISDKHFFVSGVESLGEELPSQLSIVESVPPCLRNLPWDMACLVLSDLFFRTNCIIEKLMLFFSRICS